MNSFPNTNNYFCHLRTCFHRDLIILRKKIEVFVLLKLFLIFYFSNDLIAQINLIHLRFRIMYIPLIPGFSQDVVRTMYTSARWWNFNLRGWVHRSVAFWMRRRFVDKKRFIFQRIHQTLRPTFFKFFVNFHINRCIEVGKSVCIIFLQSPL